MFRGIKDTIKKNKNYRKQSKSRVNQDIDSSSESDIDLSDLLKEISAIETENMPDDFNFQEMNFFLHTIPNFDGELSQLHNFIDTCDDIFSFYANASNLIKKMLLRNIIGKLQGQALKLISSRSELNNWTAIKDVLKISFSDQRSFTCLLSEIHNLKRNPKETPHEFAQRCQNLRSLLFTSINNDASMNNEAKVAQIGNIEKLLLTTFLKYLPFQVQIGVRLKQPDCIERALQYALEEENFYALANESKKNSFQSSSEFNKRAPFAQQASQPFPKNNYQNFRPRNFNFNQQPSYRDSQQFYRGSPQNSNFPSQPIQVNPRQVPQKFFTNQQVFGKQKPEQTNVWKPKNQTPTDRQIPMSGITRQSFRPKMTFQSQSRPTFTSEELFNINNGGPDESEINQNVLFNDNENSSAYEHHNELENFTPPASGKEIT